MTRVAVIGLGTMGLPLARRLAAAGHEVAGCDLDPTRAAELDARAETPAEAARAAEVVLLSLPSPEAVREVALGPAGVAASAPPGSLLVDASTGPPALARELAERLGARGIDVLDAPVSGGPRGAEAGTLTVMVGGEERAYARARPLLEALGSLVVHVGGHGAGQAAKLCNNLVAGVTMAALAEACAVAEREGLDPATLYALLSASTGDSRVLRNRFPLAGADDAHPSSRGFEPLFALDLIAKDLRLALELARGHGLEPGVADAALAAYEAARADGLGRLDYSAVYLSRRRERPAGRAASGQGAPGQVAVAAPSRRHEDGAVDVEPIRLDPDPYAPFRLSQGFRVGDLLFVSGQAAIDEHGEVVGEGDFDVQAEQTFRNLERVLAAGGSGLDRIVKVTIFLTDMANFPKVVELRGRWFTPPYPADTIVEVTALALPQLQIEIEAIAVAGR